MLRSINDFAKVLKKAGKEAINADNPVHVIFGQVISTSPLKISIDQRMILEEHHFTLTRGVRDHEVEMTVDSIRKKYTVHNALVVGDKVKLLRVQGGQQYVVFDKE